MNLNQLTIPALDLSISIPFYEKLGLKLIVNTTDHYARFICPEGPATFSIHKTEKLPEGKGLIVYFELENLDEKVDDLLKLGFHFDLLPTNQPWLWREAHLNDPDGNRIILYTAGENRLNPPWKLTSRENAFFKPE